MITDITASKSHCKLKCGCMTCRVASHSSFASLLIEICFFFCVSHAKCQQQFSEPVMFNAIFVINQSLMEFSRNFSFFHATIRHSRRPKNDLTLSCTFNAKKVFFLLSNSLKINLCRKNADIVWCHKKAAAISENIHALHEIFVPFRLITVRCVAQLKIR